MKTFKTNTCFIV